MICYKRICKFFFQNFTKFFKITNKIFYITVGKFKFERSVSSTRSGRTGHNRFQIDFLLTLISKIGWKKMYKINRIKILLTWLVSKSKLN